MRSSALALAMLLAFAGSGCTDSHITDAVLVTNNSAETLHFDIELVSG